jgi:hypothetical protein
VYGAVLDRPEALSRHRQRLRSQTGAYRLVPGCEVIVTMEAFVLAVVGDLYRRELLGGRRLDEGR